VALVHHEQCFGCGRTNLFGLLLEVGQTGDGSVAGRCFIKQDHQGSDPGAAHEGVLAAALTDAMALAAGKPWRLQTVELQVLGAAPVGVFLDVEAHVEGCSRDALHATASGGVDGCPVIRARGVYGR
jgi:hypothetical protein